MRAVLLEGPQRLRVTERMALPGPGAGEVLIRIMATAICGTDVEVFRGNYSAVRFPLIPGHESVGVVEELGPGVEGIQRGEHVVVNPQSFCGACSYCRRGKTNLCPQGGLLGREFPGTFAEFAVVRANQCHVIPVTVGWEEGTGLVVLSSVIRAQRRGKVGPGKSVAIIGQGASGLLHTQVARAWGSRLVIAISRSAWKLALAHDLGANVTVNASLADTVSAVRQVTSGRGADVVVDTVGGTETFRHALAMCAPAGSIVLFGVTGSVVGFGVNDLYYKEVSVIGTRAMTPEDVDAAVTAVEQGSVNLRALVTHRYRLDDLPAVMAFLSEGKHEGLRSVVLPWSRTVCD